MDDSHSQTALWLPRMESRLRVQDARSCTRLWSPRRSLPVSTLYKSQFLVGIAPRLFPTFFLTSLRTNNIFPSSLATKTPFDNSTSFLPARLTPESFCPFSPPVPIVFPPLFSWVLFPLFVVEECWIYQVIFMSPNVKSNFFRASSFPTTAPAGSQPVHNHSSAAKDLSGEPSAAAAATAADRRDSTRCSTTISSPLVLPNNTDEQLSWYEQFCMVKKN